MDKTYSLNDLAMISGFTVRTLRTYLGTGLLKGRKENGVWCFSEEEIDSFLSEPYVKEGLRIKRNCVVFDFLADAAKKQARSCVILDLPVSGAEGKSISEFFCGRLNESSDAEFRFSMERGCVRVILTGAEDQVSRIMKEYYSRK